METLFLEMHSCNVRFTSYAVFWHQSCLQQWQISASHSSHLSKPCVEEKIRICMADTQIKVGNIWGFLAKEMALDNTKFVVAMSA